MSSSRTPIRLPLKLVKKISYKISVSYKQFQQYKEGRSSLFSKSIACRNGIESEKCEATLNFETRNPSHGIPQAPRFNWTSSDEDSDNSPNSSDSEPENFMPRNLRLGENNRLLHFIHRARMQQLLDPEALAAFES